MLLLGRVLMVFMFSLSVMNQATAARGDNQAIYIDAPANYNFGLWANAGNLSDIKTSCAVATQIQGSNGLSSKNYSVKVTNLDTGDGFYLYLDGNTSNTGNRRIEVSIKHADILAGTPFEFLYSDLYESQKHPGQLPGCVSGHNSALKVDIGSAELSSKIAGDYVGNFEIWIKEGGDEFPSPTSFSISVSVGGFAKVQISHLDTVSFGQYSGTGNLSADESFCVYSEGINGAYRISLSSASQDSSGNFYMTESASGDQLPLQIFFSDSGFGSGTIPMTSNYVSAIGDFNDTNCSGNDNATLSMLLAASDLQSARSGIYQDVITILVEPE